MVVALWCLDLFLVSSRSQLDNWLRQWQSGLAPPTARRRNISNRSFNRGKENLLVLQWQQILAQGPHSLCQREYRSCWSSGKPQQFCSPFCPEFGPPATAIFKLDYKVISTKFYSYLYSYRNKANKQKLLYKSLRYDLRDLFQMCPLWFISNICWEVMPGTARRPVCCVPHIQWEWRNQNSSALSVQHQQPIPAEAALVVSFQSLSLYHLCSSRSTESEGN